MREAFRHYQREREDRQLAADPHRTQRLLELQEAVDALRRESVRAGTSQMTQKRINAEIDALRRDKKKSFKQPVR
jgi:hypothetical protein